LRKVAEIFNFLVVSDYGGGVGGWVGGWVVYTMIIMPLCGPSWKLRFARISAKLRFQDGPIMAITSTILEQELQ
jgi:hypothetical protein